MSLFDNPEYKWRETYFVYFARHKMPRLEEAVGRVRKRIPGVSTAGAARDENGVLQAVSILFPDSPSGVDIILSSPSDAPEPMIEAQNMLDEAPDKHTKRVLAHSDARVDILHFERTNNPPTQRDLFNAEDDMPPEDFDPSGMFTLIEQLVGLSRGVAIDPQSGTVI